MKRPAIPVIEDASSWAVQMVIAVVLVIAFFLLALRFIPAFVNMLDVSISNIKGK